MDPDLAEVLWREQRLLDTRCRADAECLDELLHPDFQEYGASGVVWTRQQVIDRLPAQPEPSGDASNFRPQRLSGDVILMTFTVHGARPSLRSSVWVAGADRRWQLRFHQGTLTADG